MSAGILSNWYKQADVERFLSEGTNRVEVDYANFAADARVVCVGDWHVSYAIKNEFCELVSQLKKRNFSHVALELLSTDVQPLLHEYHEACKSKKRTFVIESLRNRLVDLFFNVWGDESNAEDTELRAMSETFTQIIDSAIENDMQVLALEPPVSEPFKGGRGYALLHQSLEDLAASSTDEFRRFWAKETSAADRVALRDVLISNLSTYANWRRDDAQLVFTSFETLRVAFPTVTLEDFKLPRAEDLPGNFDQPWNDAINSWRDLSWLKVVEDALARSDTRVLVFAGAGHFGADMPAFPPDRKGQKRFSELLEEKGHEVVVFGFAGGDFPRTLFASDMEKFDLPASQSFVITDASQACGIADQRFAFQLNRDCSRESDWMVHLPRQAEIQ